MEAWGITDSGKVRQQNQDIFKILYDEDKNVAVFVVCDGIGGAKAGNVASTIAAETFMHSIGGFIEDIENAGSIDNIAKSMTDAVLAANKAVYEKSSREDDFAGMGTTLTAAISTAIGEVIANIGDSRAYHITPDVITQITRDHSVVEDMVLRGDISREEAGRHPSKHLITRALGSNRIERPDMFRISMDSCDHILLCSDGLSDMVTENEIIHELQRGAGVRECCENLVATVLARGAPDNVTAVIFRK